MQVQIFMYQVYFKGILWEHNSLQDSLCLFSRKHVKKIASRQKRNGSGQYVFVSVCVYLLSCGPLLPVESLRGSSPSREVGPMLPAGSQPS